MKVLIIGETCVDKFIYCNINRLSPEAPVPVLNPFNTVINAGMAGNTVSNIQSLSPKSQVVILGQLENIIKTRYIEQKSNHMFLRVDEGEDKITPFKWGLDIDAIIGRSDIVIVSDYNKGYLSDIDLINISRKSNLSILDSKRKLTNEVIEHFDFIKLNEGEYKNNTHLNHKGIIVTLGSKGAQHQGILYPSENPQETIDVSGAGDTFTASFIISYYDTLNIGSSILYANKQASKVVSQRGVVTPI
jgi:bifunctional ADP-heptose synthase (sugar kinase/adenylyltransferase)